MRGFSEPEVTIAPATNVSTLSNKDVKGRTSRGVGTASQLGSQHPHSSPTKRSGCTWFPTMGDSVQRTCSQQQRQFALFVVTKTSTCCLSVLKRRAGASSLCVGPFGGGVGAQTPHPNVRVWGNHGVAPRLDTTWGNVFGEMKVDRRIAG